MNLVVSSPRRRVELAVSVFALLATLGLVLAGTAAASWRTRPEMTLETSMPRHVPLVSSTSAIALLNRQRAANGIPGDLVENRSLSAGCAKHVWKYRERPGQNPHDELPGQPGYSKLGQLAASLSDLAYRSGESSTESYWWSPLVNPWSGAAFHLSELFNPEATTAWYAESPHGAARWPRNRRWPWGAAACMGASGGRAFTEPTFFSYPGGGAADVPYSEYTVEVPESPQEAVGLPPGFNGGPAVILWAVGMEATLEQATLSAADGLRVPTRLYPPSGSGGIAYVVPTTDLRPNTDYTVRATWIRREQGGSGGEPVVQVARFSTGDRTLSEQVHDANVAAGVVPEEEGTDGFSARIRGRKLAVLAFGAAKGRRLLVTAWRCDSRACDPTGSKRLIRHSFRLRRRRTTIRLPRVGGGRACASLTTVPFRLHGRLVKSSGVLYRCYRR